ncbi:SH3 domain-containing protein [Anaerobacillus sp. CMMVII]|uniref:N-acetylmuramoyl-L-alanine amidase n=1 Tax=Anaerobacillus sp. CMMVII TaxID=2755588 RepID=UPI0021B8237C|nr:N-acetylmuramoyl-L-alanine amidase [Anaerobacillus sp. CMMVII]MCT8140282.1 SH3 domain-containing protein [Anaerobacillus sp. CMMVII]
MRRFLLIGLVIIIAFVTNFQFNSKDYIVYSDNSRVAVGEVTASLLNVRSEANANARRIAQLPKGTKVSIFEIGVNKDWLKINVNNQWGFVHKDFVTITETFAPTNTLQKVAEGQVNASNLNVRSEPNTSSQRISILANGTKIDIFETGVNKDWLKIRVNDRWGFVHSSFVTITQQTKPTTPAANQVISKGRVTVNALNVRSEPRTTAKRITILAEGTQLDIYETGVNKDWLRIRVNNEWGFVHRDFVTITQGSNNPTPTTPTAPVTVVAKGQVTVNALNVRAEPNTTARRVTILAEGTQLDIYETGVNKDWLKIQVNNEWGFVHSSFVAIAQATTPAPPANQVIGKAEVTATTLNVRSEPNVTSRIIGNLAARTQVDFYEQGVNKDWLKIKVGNEWGFIHGNHVRILGNQPTIDTSKLKDKVIVIDPGHGGRDPGAVAFGLMEKDIVLSTALILEKKLQQAGAKVVLTRSTDVFLALSDRTKVVNNQNADIFLSIHVNSSSIATAHGTETFWNRNYELYNSQLLASSLQSKLVNTLSTRDRGVKEAGFEIIKYTRVPSVLIELGFLTNQNEAQRLASPQFQDQAAQAILEGLVDFYNK